MTRFREGTILWALEVLGPIRAAYRKKRKEQERRPFWLDGRHASEKEVIRAAQLQRGKAA